MIKEPKIPTLLGLFLLTLGLSAGVLLIQRGPGLVGLARGGVTPEQLKITNLAEKSFSLSWLTPNQPTTGFVAFGETPSLGSTANEDRDQAGQLGKYFTHHVTLKSLKPATKYYFKIGSAGRLYDNNGQPYTLTTAPSLTTNPPLADLAQGRVFTPEGLPAEGALVYLSLAGVTPLSSLVQSSGTWLVTLSNARSADLTRYAQYDQSAQVEEIFVQGGSAGTATAITTTGNDNPVPEITLGKTYDFRQELPGTPTPTPTLTPIQEGQIATPSSRFSLPPLTPSPVATSPGELTITNPQEKEKINTQRPEFMGTGPAGKTIQILVESPGLSKTLLVENDGTWSWTPPTALSPGEHKATVTYLEKSLLRTFTVLAAGSSELPALTATPSATITPTPTATPSARTSMPSTEAGVPEAGYLTPTFFLFIMGLGLILMGFVVKLFLALLAHGR